MLEVKQFFCKMMSKMDAFKPLMCARNGLEIDEVGNKRWYLNGLLHREGAPAVEYVDGKVWWMPAYKDDTRELFFINGDLASSHKEYIEMLRRWKLKSFS
jgi:hypothetical protein